MRIKSIREVAPEPARCIEVDSEDRLFAVGGETGAEVFTHNSVVQRNIILGTILRPESWRFIGIDLKKVELSGFRAYSNVVLGIATTLEDALTVLRFAQQTMMKRYAELEQLGLNNFLDLPEKGQALLVMVDEAGELLGSSGVKALSAHTLIPTPTGLKALENLNIGDTIFDNYNKETIITNKYEPIKQDKYSLKISKDNTNEKEEIIAGSEHNWVAYYEHPDGTIIGPELIDTNGLYKFKKEQEDLPVGDRVKIKFKRG